METKLGKIELPPWAQGVIAVAILGGLGFIGYKGMKYFEKKKEESESKKVTDDIDDELKQSEKEGLKLSKPKSSYSAAVSLIIKLLSGAETGVSEMQVVKEIISVVKNKYDWQYLIKAFGTRDIDDIGGFTSTNYNLITLLKEQLDSMPGTGGLQTAASFVPLPGFQIINGVYNIDIDGYKATGLALKTRNILKDYLKTIGIDF